MKAIAAAFVKAQKEFGPALKTNTNPLYRSKYADLSACIEAVVDALNNNGIALMQRSFEVDSGVTVETVVLHESGETLESGKLHVPATKQDAQGYGSALTYARRYSLMAACGIAPEDDDGNEASKPAKQVKQIHVSNLDADKKLSANDYATQIASMWDTGNVSGAFKAYQELREGDQEYLISVWESLKIRSDIRGALKKMHIDQASFSHNNG